MARRVAALGLDMTPSELRVVALEAEKGSLAGAEPSPAGGRFSVRAFSLPRGSISTGRRGLENTGNQTSEKDQSPRQLLRRYRGWPAAYHDVMPGEFLTIVSLPLLSASQEVSAIRWEVQRLLPGSVSDYAVDFVKLEGRSPGLPTPPGGNAYLVYGAPWSAVKASAQLVRSLGLKPKKACADAIALLRGTDYLARQSGDTLLDRMAIVVYVDEDGGSVVVSVKGVPLAARTVIFETSENEVRLSEESQVSLMAELERALRYTRRVSGKDPDALCLTGVQELSDQASRTLADGLGLPVLNPRFNVTPDCERPGIDGRYVKALGLALSLTPPMNGNMTETS
ncbi:MAG TPA: hypothetical protein GX510_09790 [Firmicutes bacterium]|nr:hypothetical protein [Candidatus Fermentithermobacillaceae bacterium]